MPCTISKNGLGIKIRTLIDTGANGFIFIDQKLAKKASQFLDAPMQTLPVACKVKGFDGQRADPITQYLDLNLHIDGQKQTKLHILIVQLGGQDLILGRT